MGSGTGAKRGPVKAVFFDYDGVLTTDKTGTSTTCKYLSVQTGIERSRIEDALRGYNHDLTIGRKSYADVWPEVCAKLGCEIPRSMLAEAFASTPLNRPMLELARRVGANYKVGIITDNKKDRMDHLRSIQRLDDVFRPIVVSAEVGSTKEDEAIFRVALRDAGVAAGESIFIDNAIENLAAARTLGMEAIYFDATRNDAVGLGLMLRTIHGLNFE